MAIGFKLRARRAAPGGLTWWQAPKYLAADGRGPSAVLDFRAGLYALPAGLDAAAVASASTTALQALADTTFANALTLASGAGTCFDANGVLQATAANTPRIDWTRGVAGLALNGPSTNLVTHGTNLSSAYWALENLSSSAGGGAGAAPEWVLNEGTSNSYHSAYDATFVTFTAGTTYTFSIVARSGSGRYLQLTSATAAIGVTQATFDLQTGTVANVSGGQAYVTALPGGNFLCEFSVVATGSGTYAGMIVVLSDGTSVRRPVYTGTGKTIIVSAPQIELGARATARIVTAGSAVTRSIETCQFGAVATALMQRAGATVVVQGARVWRDFGRILGGAGSDAPLIRQAATTLRATKTANLDASFGSGSLAGSFGVAIGFDATGRALAANQGTVVSDPNGPGDLSAAYLGRDGAGTAFGDGWYDAVVIYPFRLTAADLQAKATSYV